jgi:hypothetical protein
MYGVLLDQQCDGRHTKAHQEGLGPWWYLDHERFGRRKEGRNYDLGRLPKSDLGESDTFDKSQTMLTCY